MSTKTDSKVISFPMAKRKPTARLRALIVQLQTNGHALERIASQLEIPVDLLRQIIGHPTKP